MKIWLYIRMTMLSVMITLFFTGIIISGGSLYLLINACPGQLLYQSCVAIAVTFLTGIFSLSLANRQRERVIVYRERPKDSRRTNLREHEERNDGMDSESLARLAEKNATPEKWISELAALVQAAQAALYVLRDNELSLSHGYAISNEMLSGTSYAVGEGLVGRVAAEGLPLFINPLPEGYITIYSGLGASSPRYLSIIPVRSNKKVVGVLELATFVNLDRTIREQIEAACNALGVTMDKNSN